MTSEPSGEYRPDPAKTGDTDGLPVGTLFGLGFQFAAAIILSVLAGQWADRHFGSDPWGVLVGASLGFGAGFFSIYRTVNRANGEQGTANGDRRRGPS